MFTLKLCPTAPPIHKTLEQIASPPIRLALSNAINIIAGILCADPMWENIQADRLAGRSTGDIVSMVKARAFDIVIAHSGDICGRGHDDMNAAYMLSAVHHAVERVLQDGRRLGVIL